MRLFPILGFLLFLLLPCHDDISYSPCIDFDPNAGLSVGAIIGIVMASCVVLAFILALLWTKGYLGGKDLEDKGEINLFP